MRFRDSFAKTFRRKVSATLTLGCYPRRYLIAVCRAASDGLRKPLWKITQLASARTRPDHSFTSKAELSPTLAETNAEINRLIDQVPSIWRVRTLLGKETRIVMKWLRPLHTNFFEFGMSWIDEPIRFGRRQCGGNDKHCGTAVSDEIVANLHQFRRRWRTAPIQRQPRYRNRHSRNRVGNFRTDQHEIRGWIVRVDVHKVFNDRQGEVFGRIGKANARTGPASTKTISAFTIERFFGVGSPKDSVDRRQLRPP